MFGTSPNAGPRATVRDRLALTQARFVAGQSPERLARLESGAARRVALRSLPLALRLLFSPEAARGIKGVSAAGTVALNIRGPDGSGADPFEIVIADAHCKVRRRRNARPDASLTIGLADMVRMGSGAVDPGFFLAEGIAAGRIELKGDVFLFLSFPNLFRMANRKLI